MEDDDEFGDLYTDVLLPFGSAAPPPPPPPQAQPLRRPIDLNDLQNDDEDDAGNVFEAPTTAIPGLSSGQTLAPARPDSAPAASNFRGGAADDSNLKEEDVTFDIEEEDSGMMIPGLDSNPMREGDDGMGGGDGDDDWESEEESDDDLQIVLNGPTMMMETGDEDEDDELVIVADGDPNQAMEEQDWGDDPTAAAAAAAQSADGKDTGEGGKAGVGAVPKLGYGSHGYHPFHSQFKYVRPGAQPIPGAATSGPGGVPGQVRPIANMGPAPGRGRGDWRPMGLKNGTSMQKNFHSGFGAWGNNAAGRGFGGGLDFTLPSHKSIFEIDIDSFEEKPWRYPGADASDFFNFGFNEDSWKDYCKQLEQHRLESTMQSKIRVYESGRTEQEYDPDLPPELAAATGIQEAHPENVNPIKFEVEQSDLPKGSARVRPPLPTGRAIQVESGYGERLPSIDTRPPRMRDSDSIIEIVLQGSLDDDTPAAGDEVSNQPDDDDSKGDIGVTIPKSEISPMDTEHLEKYPQISADQKRERKIPSQNSVGNNNMPDRDGVLPFPPRPARNGAYVDGDLSPEYEERKTRERLRGKSPNTTPNQNVRDRKYHDDMPEDSAESMDSKHSPLSSPATRKDAVAHESSVELRDDVDDQDEKGDSPSDKIAVTDALEEGVVAKKQKLNSPLEEDSFEREPDDGDEDSRAARSSDNSRARSGSSRDFTKRRDGAEEEVIQRHSNRLGNNAKRHFDDKEQGFNRRNNRDTRQEPERNRVATKPREDSYPYRDFDPNSVHSHLRTDGFERRKERDNNLDGSWQRRDDDPYGRRMRAAEETRKRERGGDEMGSRHRGSKVRESERIEKDELVHSRKQMDNNGGSLRSHYDKDSVPRHRERDENNLKGRYEHMEDYHGKRKKEEEYQRREFVDKEETSHGYRENTSRWKRERDGQQRPRDNNIDDHQSSRQKDESWLQRERGERGREREEWPRVKQSYDENIPKRERDEGRGVSRSNHPKVKDESKGSDKDYQYKETVRHGEPSKRRERTEDESSHHGVREDVYGRGNQMTNGERRSRQERPRNSKDLKLHEKKQRDIGRRNRDSDGGGENSSMISSKRNQEDNGGQTNETGSKGSIEQGFGEHNSQRQSSKKLKEDASDEDQQQDSRRGRSKLERWTSHTERDFSFKSKQSTTLKLKETDMSNITESLQGTKIPEEPSNSKPIETVDSQQSLVEERDSADLDSKDGEPKPSDDRHLDTAEKLKKRSERFKLPMPSSDKEAPVIKKVENEPLAPAKTVTLVDSEVKQERPARKRRWISN